MAAPIDDEPAPDRAPPHDLLSLAASQVRSGRLPRTGFANVFAGPGENECCALCSELIGTTSVSYEVSTQDDGKTSLCFHIPCFNAWRQACLEAGD